MTNVDAAFTALADPGRRRAIELLSAGPMRAGALADAMGLSPPAMSRHLKALKTGGLIEECHPEFDSRVRLYSLKPDGLASLKTWVEQTESLWEKQLKSFKALAERSR